MGEGGGVRGQEERQHAGNGGEPARKPTHAHAQGNRQSAGDVLDATRDVCDSTRDVSLGAASRAAPPVPLLPGDEAGGTRAEHEQPARAPSAQRAAAAARLRHVRVWSAGMSVSVSVRLSSRGLTSRSVYSPLSFAYQ
jgi:hypothetical protein